MPSQNPVVTATPEHRRRIFVACSTCGVADSQLDQALDVTAHYTAQHPGELGEKTFHA